MAGLVDLVIVLVVVGFGIVLLVRRTGSGGYPDTSTLSRQRKNRISGTAVVCGGSVSGILAARVCAAHFEDVVLVDPEFTKTLNGEGKTRVMQYKSSHAFLYVFVAGLRQLWPNIDERIREAGGHVQEADMRAYLRGRRLLPPWKLGQSSPRPVVFLIRRAVLEVILQKLLVETCPNLRVVDGTVRGIGLSDRGDAMVEAVTIRDLEGKTEVLEDPALVADCTGDSRAALKWLKAAGCPIPESAVSIYDPHTRYVTITFDPSTSVLEKLPIPGGYQASPFFHTYISSSLDKEEVGTMFSRYENTLVNLMFAAFNGAELPRKPSEIVEAVKLKFTPPWMVETVKILVNNCTPTMEPATLSKCVRVHFEKVPHRLSNFVMLGDAAMKTNAVYGLGMSRAMHCATALHDLLTTCTSPEDLRKGFSRRYFAAMAAVDDYVWNTSKLNDYGFAATVPAEGESLTQGWFVRWLNRKITEIALVDEEIAARVGPVQHLVKPPSTIFTPSVLLAILKHSIL